MYGVSSHNAGMGPADFQVDRLFRPAGDSAAMHGGGDAEAAHAEAKRILTAAVGQGGAIVGDDRDRLAVLTANEAGIGRVAAAARIDELSTELQHKLAQARREAAYAALWTAFALLFGAIVSMVAAVHARAEDDRQTLAVR
jgi:hypothetical protein